MAYFKIGTVDYSNYVSGLKVTTTANYNAQTNAAGNTVVDYINQKKKIKVEFIPLGSAAVATLLTAIGTGFPISISYTEPSTQALATVSCIIPSKDIEYYTIQTGKVLLKSFTLTFTEL